MPGHMNSLRIEPSRVSNLKIRNANRGCSFCVMLDYWKSSAGVVKLAGLDKRAGFNIN